MSSGSKKSRAKLKTRRRRAEKFIGKYFVQKNSYQPYVFVGVEIEDGYLIGNIFGDEDKEFLFNARRVRLATKEEIAKAVSDRLQDKPLMVSAQITFDAMFKSMYGSVLTNLVPSGVNLISSPYQAVVLGVEHGISFNSNDGTDEK